MSAARWLFSFRVQRDSGARLIGYGVLISIALFLLSYLLDRKQAFAISAVTEFIRVETVSEGADDWSLVAAHICTPKEDDVQNSASPPAPNDTGLTPDEIGLSPDCADNFYDQRTFKLDDDNEELTLRWTDDYTLEIRDFNRGFLYVYVTRDAPTDSRDTQPVYFQDLEIPSDSILYIPVNDDEPPRLALRGYLTLGEPPVRSDAMVVRDGRYEIRQDGRRLRKHVVAEGEFFPGDRVTFEREPAPLWARWSIEKDAELAKKVTSRIFVTDLNVSRHGFDVVATTDPQFSSIYLTRVGGQPSRIPVNWAQRLTSDPIIAALATILGLLATMLALRNNFFKS